MDLLCSILKHDTKNLRREEFHCTWLTWRDTGTEIWYYVEAAGDEENEENERVALNESDPWKVQYIICYEFSWSFDIELQVLFPELPSAA